MAGNTERINQLHGRLDSLLKRQEDFSNEINNLRFELNMLKNLEQEKIIEKQEVKPKTDLTSQDKKVLPDIYPSNHKIKKESTRSTGFPIIKPQKGKSDIEKFIGENLINKIGIAITVIGVSIGIKYSIENDLISPITRIILGYIFGLGLLGVSIKFKANYKNYSAVLVSGAMAILYFITYSAYGLYDLIPQIIAFILMFIFTVFTVISAINYNRQIIAHIGLVGAYAIPFILGDDSGKEVILFSYISILNIGILAISFKKYWKQLYYVSFGLTWVIFFSWYNSNYQTNENFGITIVFLFLFFSIFYLTFLAHKIIQKEKFIIDDVILIMINSFIFYGIGYNLLDNHDTGQQLLGLITLINAAIHLVVSIIIYQQKLEDKNIFYLIAGMALIFITISIPVQLNGNWVTSLWAGEAALLFWIGRTRNVWFYEKLSLLVMLLAFFSILQDWNFGYDLYNRQVPETRITPLLNVNFLNSILFISAFLFINILNQNKKYSSILKSKKEIFKIISYSLPTIFIFAVYYAFRIEIANYWNQLHTDSLITINQGDQIYTEKHWNNDLSRFKIIWTINYSLVFVSILSFFNLKKFKNHLFEVLNISLIILALVVFLTQGLFILSELRESYLEQTLPQYYKHGLENLWIRYISFPLVALILYTFYRSIKQEFFQRDLKIAFELVLHSTILWIASSELINWMDIAETEQSYKIGLSILWGVYSLFLISFGIWKKNKPMRIGAILLFGITLLKLFLYDISNLNTIAKTVVFVSLGVLLLIISFLYTKYKNLITDDPNINETI